MSHLSLKNIAADTDSDCGDNGTDDGNATIGEPTAPSGEVESDAAPTFDEPAADGGDYETELPPRRRLRRTRGRRWLSTLGLWVLPLLALILAVAAGWLKWQIGTAQDTDVARTQSVQAATEGTVAILSYEPDTVDHDLAAARDRLTGQFRDSYTSLTHDVVAPGAKEKKVSAQATVPAAASISASPTHATVLVFVNQTTVVDNGAPTGTVSSVRVTLDRIDGRWLISGFEPV